MARDRYVLVLARSPQEGSRYAKRMGIPASGYRAVVRAASIRGIRRADVHILPSFLNRPDRFSIFSEFRYARDIEFFYVDPADFETPPVDQGDGMGEQLEFDNLESALNVLKATAVSRPVDRAVDDWLDLLDKGREAIAAATVDGNEPTRAPEPSEDPAPPVKRRRSKCPRCLELHFKGDPCAPETQLPTPENFF